MKAALATLEDELELITQLLHKNHNQHRRTLQWRAFVQLHKRAERLATSLRALRDSDYDRLKLPTTLDTAVNSSTAVSGSASSCGGTAPSADSGRLTFADTRRADSSTFTTAQARLRAALEACTHFTRDAMPLCRTVTAVQQGAGFAGLLAVLVASAAVYVDCARTAGSSLALQLQHSTQAASQQQRLVTQLDDAALFITDKGPLASTRAASEERPSRDDDELATGNETKRARRS